MAGDPRRYLFNPLERRGLLLGVRGGQLAVLLGGSLLALACARALRGGAGAVSAACSLVVAGLAALWPLRGQPPVEWFPVLLGWVARRLAGPAASGAPLAGAPLELPAGPARRAPGRGPARAPLPAGRRRGRAPRQPGGPPRAARRLPHPQGVALLAAPDEPGQPELGVIQDRWAGTWAAVLPVAGRSFALLDPDDKVRRLAGWGTALAAMSRPGTPLRRVQWVERCAPGDPSGLAAAADELPPADGTAAAARTDYRRLVAGAGPAAHAHEVWLVLAVPGPRRPGGDPARPVEALRREVRLVQGQLRNAELGAPRPLGLDDLHAVLAAAQHAEPVAAGRRVTGGPVPAGGAPARRHPWALATDEAWAAVRVDGSWHATYWVAEWPRVEVGPDFLTPLLATGGPRSLSVVMAPVAPDRALRQAAAARTADLADEELRRRAGFLASARRAREAAGAARREQELADGHAELRFSGYVTVSAADRRALERSAAQLEHAAQAARLDVRRLYGRQAEAFTWTLPLARAGVRPPRPHRGTTAHLQALYPFVAEDGLPCRGPLIGRDLLGGAFCFDPWELYRHGALTNPNVLVLGQIGRGKSTFVKTFVWRQVAFGRQAWIVDPKGEYEPLAAACSAPVLRLRPGGDVRLNPLDPPRRADAAAPVATRRRAELLCSLAGSSLDRPLSPPERTAVELAVASVEAAHRRHHDRRAAPTLPDVVAALLDPDPAAAASVRTDVGGLRHDGRLVALELRRLVEGDLAGMFDGPTSAGLDLDAPVVVLDLSAVFASPALAVLMTCATAWFQAVLGERSGVKRLVVVDEAWAVLHDLATARWLQAAFKLSRALGVANVAVVHRLSDLRAAGGDGSAQQRLAEGLLADSETRVVFGQPSSEAVAAGGLLGLTGTERDLLPHLPRGVALWQVGDRSFLVEHTVGPHEAGLVDTDQAMRAVRA